MFPKKSKFWHTTNAWNVNDDRWSSISSCESAHRSFFLPSIESPSPSETNSSSEQMLSILTSISVTETQDLSSTFYYVTEIWNQVTMLHFISVTKTQKFIKCKETFWNFYSSDIQDRHFLYPQTLQSQHSHFSLAEIQDKLQIFLLLKPQDLHFKSFCHWNQKFDQIHERSHDFFGSDNQESYSLSANISVSTVIFHWLKFKLPFFSFIEI